VASPGGSSYKQHHQSFLPPLPYKHNHTFLHVLPSEISLRILEFEFDPLSSLYDLRNLALASRAIWNLYSILHNCIQNGSIGELFYGEVLGGCMSIAVTLL